MSAESPTGFDQLLAQVRARADAADAAGLLDAAVAVSAGHAAAADRLLDHFVAHARGTGMSWTDIGARLGVSKQAARQRFAAPAPLGALPFAARPAPRLQTCLDRARYVAQADGAVEVRTQHLLAVLALDPGSRARRVLNDLGVDIAAIKGDLQCHIAVNPTRPARWWKRRPPTQPRCSFFGQTPPPVGRLVNGPGIAICGPCIALARQILERDQPAA